jgi:hypothetical protein
VQHTDPLRIRVAPRGNGYVAESRSPEITALGSTPEEAAENARSMALALYDDARPTTMLLRICEPGRETIVMQPANRVVAAICIAEELSLQSTTTTVRLDDLRHSGK